MVWKLTSEACSLSGRYDADKNSVIKEMEGKKIKILSIKDQIHNKKLQVG
jgi:hypothetical protein